MFFNVNIPCFFVVFCDKMKKTDGKEQKSMEHISVIDCETALNRLMAGNKEYLIAKEGKGDISEEIRILTHEYGQKPYAIVIACSDSRVIPEKIFMVGIGEIFTIRVAGNVIGDFELGSIEYAAGHLGARHSVPCSLFIAVL